MNHKYEDEVKLIIEKTDFTEHQIFDINFSPYVIEFINSFNFYRQALSNASKYGVNSSYIFYYNDNSSNAKAGVSKGNGIIFFNAGLIIFQIQNLLEKIEIDTVIKNEFPKLHVFLDNPGNKLVYQAAQHFTFYHELGHLIQQSEKLKSYLSEKATITKEFDLINHKLELDADTFSAITIGAHIHQYIFKILRSNLTSEKVENIIEIFCSGILLYFMSFESFKDDIYYEEGTHPHPIIRIFNVIMIITKYCKESPKIKEKGIEINHFDVIQRTLNLTFKIEEKSFGSTKSRTFLETLKTEKNEILLYYKKLQKFIPKDFALAEYKWNETIKN